MDVIYCGMKLICRAIWSIMSRVDGRIVEPQETYLQGKEKLLNLSFAKITVIAL